MSFIKRIETYVRSLDEQRFKTYATLIMLAVILLLSLLFFRHYRTLGRLNRTIANINEQREQARVILGQAQRVKKQRADVDALIAAEPTFKIGGYFGELLRKLKLNDKNPLSEVTTIDHEGKYRESILKAKLTDLNMKELSELLNELEQNKRIYTKDLEIVAVKKEKPAIDVTITIATLEPKTTA